MRRWKPTAPVQTFADDVNEALNTEVAELAELGAQQGATIRELTAERDEAKADSLKAGLVVGEMRIEIACLKNELEEQFLVARGALLELGRYVETYGELA